MFRMSIGGTFLLPLMFQVGFGFTPFQSGSLTFASALGALFMKAVAPPIVRRFGFRQLLVWNAVICAAIGVTIYGLFRPSWPLAPAADDRLPARHRLFPARCNFTCINAIGYSDIPLMRA